MSDERRQGCEETETLKTELNNKTR